MLKNQTEVVRLVDPCTGQNLHLPWMVDACLVLAIRTPSRAVTSPVWW